MTKIATFAFAGRPFIKYVNFPASLTAIGEYAFAGTSIRRIVLPASVANIGEGAFWTNIRLLSVEVKGSATPAELGQGAFRLTAYHILYYNEITYIRYALDGVIRFEDEFQAVFTMSEERDIVEELFDALGDDGLVKQFILVAPEFVGLYIKAWAEYAEFIY